MSDPIEPCGLTAEQKSKWGDTMSLMAWTCPGFRHLWYRLLANNDGEYIAVPSKKIPIAATDGKNILINPDTFFDYSLKERVFIGAHEVVHNVYDDVGLLHRMKHETHVTCSDGTQFPYKPEIMQKAMDYRINALLVESKIGQMPACALYDPEIAKAKDGVLDTYGKVYKQDQDNGGGPGPGAGKSPGKGNAQGNNGFDDGGLLPPGSSTGQSPGAAPRNPQQWAVEVAAAAQLESMRARGHMAGSLQHMFADILDPKIPWTDHIQAVLNRHTGSGTYNWRKPDRRFITRDLYMPGKSGFSSGWIVVWGDTSGSIGENDLNKYLGELAGVVGDLNPKRLTVIWCDARIHHVDEVEDTDDLRKIKARGVGGRGGTSVEPVFDWIANERGEVPDAFIGFTDGEVSFPDKPPYPVVWASIHEDKDQYPYGEVVYIK
jgi:predicted metal-dependent peptidase